MLLSVDPTSTPTLASALTLIAVVGQGVFAHLKGRRGKREGARRDKELEGVKDEMRDGFARIESKLDKGAERMDEHDARIATNHDRINGAFFVLTGGRDEMGENGVRGVSRDHETRLRELEKRVS